MHPDQLVITAATVEALVDEQFPAWRELPVEPVGSEGTVHALFRIGEELVARLPLQPDAVGTVRARLEAEARAAHELAGRTRFATPQPVAIGEPGAGYQLPWTVQTWLPGTTASECDPGGSVDFARDLAAFITDVRAIDPRGRTFTGTGRGSDLRAHDDWLELCFERSTALVDVPRMRRHWAAMRELPRRDPDAMTHGDLIPGNVLVHDERLVGVLDVGGLAAADPALDLVCAWHLLEPAPRQELRSALACDETAWARGRAWAFQQAMGALWYYVDTNPAMATMAARTLARIDTEPAAESAG